ncbi:MAG: radical SAM protein [Armatimonadota bacterium]
MPDAIYEATGVYPICGVVTSPKQLDLPGDTQIDLLPPDYSLLDTNVYAVNETYYAYTTRGCTNSCPWCGVPKIEPAFVPYVDIRPMLTQLRSQYGDKPILKLMDNNVLASPQLSQIVADLIELGYGRGEFTESEPRKQRVVDFNQGLDASYLNEQNAGLIGSLNIRPMRFAFDRVQEREVFVRAVGLALGHGVSEFSVYMLYNFNDSPRDLYERLRVSIDLNTEWLSGQDTRLAGPIWSYPMRYAPIDEKTGEGANRRRDVQDVELMGGRDWRSDPVWTPRFLRNVEIMKGAAHGAISNTPSLAMRTIGDSFEEFLFNLYMPEELLRNRNRHERKVYEYEPNRAAGTGKVEGFRSFVSTLLNKQDARFRLFHEAVAPNTMRAIRTALAGPADEEMKQWLKHYLKPE